MPVEANASLTVLNRRSTCQRQAVFLVRALVAHIASGWRRGSSCQRRLCHKASGISWNQPPLPDPVHCADRGQPEICDAQRTAHHWFRRRPGGLAPTLVLAPSLGSGRRAGEQSRLLSCSGHCSPVQRIVSRSCAAFASPAARLRTGASAALIQPKRFKIDSTPGGLMPPIPDAASLPYYS